MPKLRTQILSDWSYSGDIYRKQMQNVFRGTLFQPVLYKISTQKSELDLLSVIEWFDFMEAHGCQLLLSSNTPVGINRLPSSKFY